MQRSAVFASPQAALRGGGLRERFLVPHRNPRVQARLKTIDAVKHRARHFDRGDLIAPVERAEVADREKAGVVGHLRHSAWLTMFRVRLLSAGRRRRGGSRGFESPHINLLQSRDFPHEGLQMRDEALETLGVEPQPGRGREGFYQGRRWCDSLSCHVTRIAPQAGLGARRRCSSRLAPERPGSVRTSYSTDGSCIQRSASSSIRFGKFLTRLFMARISVR